MRSQIQPPPPQERSRRGGNTVEPTSSGPPDAAERVFVRVAEAEKTPAKRPRETAERDLPTLAARNAPAWLVSAAFHMGLLIVLALIFLPQLGRQRIMLKSVWAEKLGEQLEFDSPLAGNAPEGTDEPVLTPDDLPPVEDPFAGPADVSPVIEGVTATSKLPATKIGMALWGRQEGMRRALLAAFGGNETTEAAVNKGLEWLARVQRPDGNWSLEGPYADGSGDENREAATAMALLAFQGQGHTHQEGKFAKNVAQGWDRLLKQQDDDGNFFHEGAFNHKFYTQGLCTIALCEIYSMTKDEKFRGPAERAVSYCLYSQASEGGWRYGAETGSDVSVTGWIVMALQSARMAGIDVPQDNLRRVERFLDKVGSEGGTRYPYQAGGMPKLSMTAEALLCRQYLGWSRDDGRLLDGVGWITQPENLVNYDQGRNVYYWYYATQVAHHMGDPYWKRWNEVMRQEVPEHQEQSGREAGSWSPDPDDLYDPLGGRLYVTCLSIYMLEVYYRHLPIYSNPFTLMELR